MVHQPNGLMFHKQALVITTAAGAGMRSTIKDVKDSLDFWGVGRVYAYKKAVAAAEWSGIPSEKQNRMIGLEFVKDQKSNDPNPELVGADRKSVV